MQRYSSNGFALIGAWITQLSSSPILGTNQQHLFNDAIVLSLFGIGMFLMRSGTRETFDPVPL